MSDQTGVGSCGTDMTSSFPLLRALSDAHNPTTEYGGDKRNTATSVTAHWAVSYGQWRLGGSCTCMLSRWVSLSTHWNFPCWICHFVANHEHKATFPIMYRLNPLPWWSHCSVPEVLVPRWWSSHLPATYFRHVSMSIAFKHSPLSRNARLIWKSGLGPQTWPLAKIDESSKDSCY